MGVVVGSGRLGSREPTTTPTSSGAIRPDPRRWRSVPTGALPRIHPLLPKPPTEQDPGTLGRARGLPWTSHPGGSMPALRSRTTTHGRNMAGARALWRATGMTNDDFGKPIVAVANSFTQFVPGHVHLKDMGQLVCGAIAEAGGVGREFNTIAVDDGIAMGHGGMLYSLPSREVIADAVEYMVNAHCADALVCISNCDKITPGMLIAAMRLNIPTVFVSGGPMEAGRATIAGENERRPRPRRRDGPGGRPERLRRADADRRGERLSDLRLLLRHVHRQLDELPRRGARPRAPRQRLHPRHRVRPQGPVPPRRQDRRRAGEAVVRRRRRLGPAALDRDQGRVRERHAPRHRHGRVDEHRAAPARRGRRGRGRLRPARHRRRSRA